MAFDIYATIADRIISELENGIIPWQKPWTGVRSGAISHSTGRPYSLLNQLMLGRPGEYITFKQCSDEGGKVKAGSKAKMVVFWKPIMKEKLGADGKPVKDKDGNTVIESIPYLQYFQVFHIDECENINPRFAVEGLTPTDPIAEAETVIDGYVKRSKVNLEHHKQNEAFYSPSRDLISMPQRDQFIDSEGYYGTLFHEAAHSTGHKSRLDRFDGSALAAAFGSESYSKEELVAEISSATLLNELGIETRKTFRNTAAYIQSWMRALKNDKRLIVSAAGRAEKAVKLILNV